MTLASLLTLQWYGPHCVSAVGTAVASAETGGEVTCNGDGVDLAAASSPSSPLTDGRRGEGVGIAVASSERANGGTLARGNAVGVVNALTQTDIIAALQQMLVSPGITFLDVMQSLRTDVPLVKAKTDQMQFTGGALDGNMTKVKGQTVDGAGTEADPWGPA